jgi:hypothetical protein
VSAAVYQPSVFLGLVAQQLHEAAYRGPRCRERSDSDPIGLVNRGGACSSSNGRRCVRGRQGVVCLLPSTIIRVTVRHLYVDFLRVRVR